MASPPYSLADLRNRRDEIEALAARSGIVNIRVFVGRFPPAPP
jgi:hypothetical protein